MQKTTQKEDTSTDIIEKMFEAGVHYGYGKHRRHPSVTPHVYTTKNKTDILNLEHTSEMFENASLFVEKLVAEGKTILLVGTKPEARGSILKMSETIEMPFVTLRWIGGTLTNFSEIKKRIQELETLTKEKQDGSWSKYTKKEALDLSKKMKKLEGYYGGMVGLKKIPDALFIVDPKKEHIALAEAIDAKIPVIAILNSDTNKKKITYPILGNDTGVKSIKFLTEALTSVWKTAFSKKEKV